METENKGRQPPFKINMTCVTSEILGRRILSELETTEAWVVPIYKGEPLALMSAPASLDECKLTDKKQYVVGFLFNGNSVALIRKNRPDWQVGKLNGIGGHIEQGETPLQAMKREFSEEAGDYIEEWEYYCTMNYPEADVHVFRLFGNYQITTKTDEPVSWFPISDLPELVIPNLHWLIPLAHHDDKFLLQVSFNPNTFSAYIAAREEAARKEGYEQARREVIQKPKKRPDLIITEPKPKYGM